MHCWLVDHLFTKVDHTWQFMEIHLFTLSMIHWLNRFRNKVTMDDYQWHQPWYIHDSSMKIQLSKHDGTEKIKVT